MIDLIAHSVHELDKYLFQNGFKTFLGISPQVTGWNAAGDEFSLIIENNPLAEFVELPEGHNTLWYSSVLVGAIKGALEMVGFNSLFNFYYTKMVIAMETDFVSVTSPNSQVERFSNVNKR